MHELDPLSLLLFSESLSPLSLLETFTERVVVVKVYLEETVVRSYLSKELLRTNTRGGLGA